MSPGSEFVAVPADAAFRVFRRQADQTSSRWLLRCRLLASEWDRLSPNREGEVNSAGIEPDRPAGPSGMGAAYPPITDALDSGNTVAGWQSVGERADDGRFAHRGATSQRSRVFGLKVLDAAHFSD